MTIEVKKLVEWTDDLSVGLQEIDEQHKILVSLVNRLYEAIITNREHELIATILNELVDYTIIHFAVEESLMRIFDYPQYEQHKYHHEELSKQVIELQKKVIEGEAEISMDVLNFLRAWLTNHIMIEDKHYGPFLVKQGLKTSWTKRTFGKIWSYAHK